MTSPCEKVVYSGSSTVNNYRQARVAALYGQYKAVNLWCCPADVDGAKAPRAHNHLAGMLCRTIRPCPMALSMPGADWCSPLPHSPGLGQIRRSRRCCWLETGAAGRSCCPCSGTRHARRSSCSAAWPPGSTSTSSWWMATGGCARTAPRPRWVLDTRDAGCCCCCTSLHAVPSLGRTCANSAILLRPCLWMPGCRARMATLPTRLR